MTDKEDMDIVEEYAEIRKTTKLATLKTVLEDLNNIYLCSETNDEFFRKISHLKEKLEAKIKEAGKHV